MGQIAEDMLDGTCCDICGCYYEKGGKLFTHDHTATCNDCWNDLTEDEKKFHTQQDKGINQL